MSEKDLRERMAENFDPSDVDGAMQLAYAALELLRHAQKAIDTDNANLRMGRDQANQLAAAIDRAGQRLGLLGSRPLAGEILEFRRALTVPRSEGRAETNNDHITLRCPHCEQTYVAKIGNNPLVKDGLTITPVPLSVEVEVEGEQ